MCTSRASAPSLRPRSRAASSHGVRARDPCSSSSTTRRHRLPAGAARGSSARGVASAAAVVDGGRISRRCGRRTGHHRVDDAVHFLPALSHLSARRSFSVDERRTAATSVAYNNPYVAKSRRARCRLCLRGARVLRAHQAATSPHRVITALLVGDLDLTTARAWLNLRGAHWRSGTRRCTTRRYIPRDAHFAAAARRAANAYPALVARRLRGMDEEGPRLAFLRASAAASRSAGAVGWAATPRPLANQGLPRRCAAASTR